MSAKAPRSPQRERRDTSDRTVAQAPRPAAAISPARSVAFDILTLVAQGNAHSDDLLHSSRTASLSPADRNLATALVMGTLRWQIALDARIGRLLTRPDQAPAQPVALALRMGAFQLLHMDRVPAHAVLNESVELCRAAGHAHAAGMVNAVLRKLTAQAQPGTRSAKETKRSAPIFESSAALAERLGHPLWLVERWASAYGREAALAICEYDQREPQAGSLFAHPGEDLGDASLPGEAAAPPSGAALQIDDGSRLVAELAATALPITADRAPRVWDSCAAPGGKTLVLAERLPSAAILATDISAGRLARMAERVRRSAHAARVRCEVMDAAKSDPADGANANDAAFDLILCDVPCSGTGTLARNPEIRHRLRPADLARHAERQRAILLGAVNRLAPGGRLLYSTCSLEAEENEQVVEAIAAKSGVRCLPIEPLIEQLARTGILAATPAEKLLRSAIREGSLRTIPGIQPCDGFFAALLERE